MVRNANKTQFESGAPKKTRQGNRVSTLSTQQRLVIKHASVIADKVNK